MICKIEYVATRWQYSRVRILPSGLAFFVAIRRHGWMQITTSIEAICLFQLPSSGTRQDIPHLVKTVKYCRAKSTTSAIPRHMISAVAWQGSRGGSIGTRTNACMGFQIGANCIWCSCTRYSLIFRVSLRSRRLDLATCSQALPFRIQDSLWPSSWR